MGPLNKQNLKKSDQVAATRKSYDNKKSDVDVTYYRKCYKCEEDLDNEDTQIVCEICSKDYHHECFGVPSSIINRPSKASYILCCGACNISCKNFLAKIARNEERIDKIESTLAAVRSDTSGLQDAVSHVQDDVSNLGEGIYFVKLYNATNNETIVRKLVKR